MIKNYLQLNAPSLHQNLLIWTGELFYLITTLFLMQFVILVSFIK